jgi:hypothetical protein
MTPEAESPFARSKVTPDPLERVIAAVIWRHRGRANAISAAHLTKITGKDDRTVRAIVEQLVITHRILIGGSSAGYYIIVDAADLEADVARRKAQIFATWRRLRVLLEPHQLAHLHGQLLLDE